MFSRILKLNGVLFLLVALLITACEKDTVIDTNNPDESVLNFRDDDPDSPHRPNCFDIVFPVTIAFPDGSNADVSDAQALKMLMQDWRANNPNATERPSFVYPIEVEYSDGSMVTVESSEDLRNLRSDCDHPVGPNWFRGRRCFNLVYPVTLVFPDGSTTSINSGIELKQTLRNWRMENPDATEFPGLEFPVDVEFPNGDIMTAEDAETLHELRDNCDHPSGPNWYRHRWCIDLVFPVSVEFPNGNVVEVDGPRQLRIILRAWRLTHPNATDHPNLVYPLQAELPNGNIVDVNGPMGLRALLEACDRPCGPFDHPSFRCYDLVFPVTVVFPNDSTAVAEDGEGLRQMIIEWRMENPDADSRPSFEFPVEVELPNGEIRTVQNENQLRHLREACRRPCFPRLNRCFDIVFPVSLEYPNGEVVEIQNGLQLRIAIRNWRQNHPNATERPHLVYPFEVELDDETVVSVETPEQFQMIIEACHP
jgi:hypothetical protein